MQLLIDLFKIIEENISRNRCDQYRLVLDGLGSARPLDLAPYFLNVSTRPVGYLLLPVCIYLCYYRLYKKK